jgi:hypothetical protein
MYTVVVAITLNIIKQDGGYIRNNNNNKVNKGTRIWPLHITMIFI